MENIQIKEFLKKYAENKYTEQEHQEFIDWLNGQSLNRTKKILKEYYDINKDTSKIEDTIKQTLTEERRQELLSKIEQAIVGENVKHMRRNVVIRKIAAIAAMLIVSLSVFYYFMNPDSLREEKILGRQNDITSLILQDGSVLNLDSIKTGEEITQGGVKIQRSEDGQLIYNISDEPGNDGASIHNTINTSTGRQSFVKLSDGTKVWLNAASSLKFPVSFPKESRAVELLGEAYFEVNKEKRTFKVITNGQEIEVLGTHFNVDAYGDNPYVKTTLLEGSVKVNSPESKQSIVLRPGEQGIGDDTGLSVKEVDVWEVMGWKRGMFVFSNEPIHTVMKEISRWYNVEIAYKGQITKEGFVMNISRSENINEVLKKLELTGLVNFKTEGRRVTVMP
jgi:transmembrane sensor